MKSIIDVSELRGPLGELLDQFSSAENGRERFEEFKLWQKSVSSLLQPGATVEVAAVKRFVARERLAATNIGWTGENLKRLFLDKVEENVPAGRITISFLVQPSLDFEIQAALGRARRVIHLAHLFQLLEKQAKGQAGPLLTSGMANVAYCFGGDGNVWAVHASWDSFVRYWYVEAYSVGSPIEWDAGFQVLSQASGA